MTDSTQCKSTNQDYAKMIVNSEALKDYRVANDSPFEGIIIRCSWDEKEQVKETIYRALRLYVK